MHGYPGHTGCLPASARFFSLHYLLPFVIVGASVIHLAALHQYGSSNPLGTNSTVDKVGLYPYFYVSRFESGPSCILPLTKIKYLCAYSLRARNETCDTDVQSCNRAIVLQWAPRAQGVADLTHVCAHMPPPACRCTSCAPTTSRCWTQPRPPRAPSPSPSSCASASPTMWCLEPICRCGGFELGGKLCRCRCGCAGCACSCTGSRK